MRRSSLFAALTGFAALALAPSAGAAPGPVVEPSPAASFAAPLAHPISSPAELAVADFDEDGVADFVTLNRVTGRASIMLGAGTATTAVAPQLAATFHGPSPSPVAGGLKAADLDRDGHLDLIVYSQAYNTVLVARGLGDGTFAAPSETSAVVDKQVSPIALVDLIVADVDEDGRPDVVVAARDARAVNVLKGDGLGGLTATAALSPPAGPRGLPDAPTSLVAGDLDDDGHLDLIVTTAANGGNAIAVFRGNGAGFDAPTKTSHGDVPLAPRLADVNEGGKPDLLYRDVTGKGGGGVRLQLGNGDGTFGNAAQLGGQTEGATPGVADLNGDGHLDLAMLAGEGRLYVRLGFGDGTFGTPTVAAKSSQEFLPTVADFDGDGDPDVATINSAGVQAYVNTGTPTDGTDKALISELRPNGPGGDGDEYLQIYNRSITTPLDLGGWSLRTSGAGPLLQRQVTVPYGTVVPTGGHLLLAMASGTGYSMGTVGGSALRLPFAAGGLEALPGGEIGVALRDPSGRTIDAVGFNGAPAGFVEGDGLLPITAGGQRTYLRRYVAGAPTDTGDNRSDFLAVDTAPVAGSGAVLGAPRPDGLTSPTVHTDFLQSSLVSPAKAQDAEPNAIVRNDKETGLRLLTINRVITNCSGLTKGVCENAKPGLPKTTITKLRFRITGLTTDGSPGTPAILRAGTTTVLDRGPSAPRGLTLEAPSLDAKGGVNATLVPTQGLSEGGLKSGQSIVVAFQFVVARRGSYSFAFNAEDDLIAEADDAPAPSPTPGAGSEPASVSTELPPASAAAGDVTSGVVAGPSVALPLTASPLAPLAASPSKPTPKLVCKGTKSVLIKATKSKTGKVVPARCVTKKQAAAIKKAAAKAKAAAKKQAAKEKAAAKKKQAARR